MTALAYLGLGSNVQAEHHLTEAARLLVAIEGVFPEAISPVYQTPPWGDPYQDDYLNAVAAVRTTLSPFALLDAMLTLEHRLHRLRTRRWGPRTLDIDLLIYDDLVIESDRLTVPHPRLHERAFVLVPLCDLAPDLRHPVLGRTVREMLAEVDPAGIVRTQVTLTLKGVPGE